MVQEQKLLLDHHQFGSCSSLCQLWAQQLQISIPGGIFVCGWQWLSSILVFRENLQILPGTNAKEYLGQCTAWLLFQPFLQWSLAFPSNVWDHLFCGTDQLSCLLLVWGTWSGSLNCFHLHFVWSKWSACGSEICLAHWQKFHTCLNVGSRQLHLLKASQQNQWVSSSNQKSFLTICLPWGLMLEWSDLLYHKPWFVLRFQERLTEITGCCNAYGCAFNCGQVLWWHLSGRLNFHGFCCITKEVQTDFFNFDWLFSTKGSDRGWLCVWQRLSLSSQDQGPKTFLPIGFPNLFDFFGLVWVTDGSDIGCGMSCTRFDGFNQVCGWHEWRRGGPFTAHQSNNGRWLITFGLFRRSGFGPSSLVSWTWFLVWLSRCWRFFRPLQKRLQHCTDGFRNFIVRRVLWTLEHMEQLVSQTPMCLVDILGFTSFFSKMPCAGMFALATGLPILQNIG